MHIQHRFIFVIISSLFLLAACGEMPKKESNTVNYKTALPNEMSPAFSEFLLYYSNPLYGNIIERKEDSFIISVFNMEAEPEKMEYYSISEDALKTFFNPLLEAEEPEKEFHDLADHFETEMLVEAKGELEMYPGITLDQDNRMTVRTKNGEKTFDLVEWLTDFGVQKTDELVLEVDVVTEDAFEIKLNNTDVEDNKFVNIFMKQDFSDVKVVSGYTKEYYEAVIAGELDAFQDIVFMEKLDATYMLLNDRYGVYDQETEEVQTIADSDFLSFDGKYVYVAGAEDPLEEGMQRIQKVGDYVAGNDEFEAAFELNYEEISEAIGLESTGNVSTGKVTYFKENFVVLFLNYTAPVAGTAGSTNVLIDLTEKENPTYYVVDLGLH